MVFLYFCLDDLLTESRELIVSLSATDSTDDRSTASSSSSFGSRPLKSECRQSQLSTLLNQLVSPDVALQQSFGCNNLSELDQLMVDRLQQQMPDTYRLLSLLGLASTSSSTSSSRPLIDLLDDDDNHNDVSPDQSNESNTEIHSIDAESDDAVVVSPESNSQLQTPTLLHFAAEFNLVQLARQLLALAGPQSVRLCSLRNSHGLNAFQVAYRAKHTQLIQLLRPHMGNDQTLLKSMSTDFIDIELPEQTDLVQIQTNHHHSSPQPRPDSGASTLSTCTDQSLTSIEVDQRSNSPASSLLDHAQQDYCNLLPLAKPIRAPRPTTIDAGDYDVLLYDKPRKAILTKSISSNRLNEEKSKSIDCSDVCDVVDGVQSMYINSELFSTPIKSERNNSKSESILAVPPRPTDAPGGDSLSESQLELVQIMNAFKYGSHSIEQIESMFKQWQQKYKVNVSETADTPSNGKQSVPESSKSGTSIQNRLCKTIDVRPNLETLRKTASLDSVTLVANTRATKSNANRSIEIGSNQNRRLADWLHQLAGKLRHRSAASSKLIKKDKHSKSNSILLSSNVSSMSSTSTIGRGAYSSHPLPSKNSLMLRGARLAEMRQKSKHFTL